MADSTGEQVPADPQKASVSGKKWLIAIICGYAALVLWYFFVSPAELLKYSITIFGIVLGTVVREAVDKEWKVLRLIAILVPTIVIAAVQARESYQTSRTKQAEMLEKDRERARKVEVDVREQLILDPRDSIDAIQDSDRGFIAKADALAFRATLKNGQTQEDIARLNKLQAAYRAAAVDFATIVKPEYKKMQALKERSIGGQKEFEVRLHAVTERVARLAARHGIAGLYNHAAALSQAAKQGERTLAYAYQALILEPDHLPAYDSIGYALWIFNEDAFGGLKYAELGLKECERQRKQLGGQDASRFKSYLDKMELNLQLQYAYFSALQYLHEEQARKYASNQFKVKPDDAEIQDTWGYVLMRFAKNIDDVEIAKDLFQKAINNPEAERATKRLAQAHVEQANATLAALKKH